MSTSGKDYGNISTHSTSNNTTRTSNLHSCGVCIEEVINYYEYIMHYDRKLSCNQQSLPE